MKFLVDAHLPAGLCAILQAAGHTAIHTSRLSAQNKTSDEVINERSTVRTTNRQPQSVDSPNLSELGFPNSQRASNCLSDILHYPFSERCQRKQSFEENLSVNSVCSCKKIRNSDLRKISPFSRNDNRRVLCGFARDQSQIKIRNLKSDHPAGNFKQISRSLRALIGIFVFLAVP
jgi:hypothetical protein